MTAPRPGAWLGFTRRRRRIAATLLPFLVVVGGAWLHWRSRAEAPREYQPGQSVQGLTRDLDRTVPPGYRPVRFDDVAEAAGLRFRHFHGARSSQLPEDMGSGLAWGDYDGDGDPDLFCVNEAGALTNKESWPTSPARCQLFRNEGDGTFRDVTDEAGVGLRVLGMGAAWADIEGDGDLDLLVTTFEALRLLRNRGDGTFEEVTRAAGLTRKAFWSGASFADYDRDGDLDLYACAYVAYTLDPRDRTRAASQYDTAVPATLNPATYPPQPNALYRNRGDGTFEEVATAAGVANPRGRSLGAAWCDFDQDGWPDLYVANDLSDNAFFRNQGNGTFADASHSAWVADYRGAMGIAVGDWDLDGDQDLFLSHWIAQENALYQNLFLELAGSGKGAVAAGTGRRAETADTERGTADTASGTAGTGLHFVDEAEAKGLGQIALDYVGWGAFFGDVDNDGRPDLFVANGSTFQREDDPTRLVAERSLLFWNAGPDRGFFEVGALSGADLVRPAVARGAAPADYDGDGDVDLAVLRHGEPLALLRNDGVPGRHWLEVRLRGAGKNTFAVGATVAVTAGSRTQTQVVGATPSYLSQPDLTLHFGLGAAERVDRLEVWWPSGRRTVHPAVRVDRVLAIREGL